MDRSELSMGNETTNGTFESELLWYRYDFWTGCLMCIAYGAVFVVGLLGNVMVTVAVLSGNRTMRRSVTNVFLVNLAIADLLVVIACLPFTLVAHLIYPWVMGPVICKLLPFAQGVSVCASVYTLVAVAVERYRSISSPWAARLGRSACRTIIGAIWLGSALVTLPWLVVFRQESANGTPICTEEWRDPFLGDVYFVVAHLTLCYVAPLIVIALCYAMICKRIWSREIPGSPVRSATPPNLTGEKSEKRTGQINLHRAKTRALRMLAVVVAVFALSWLPFYAAFARFKLAPEMRPEELAFWEVTMPIAQWLSSANSCINPILYHFLDARFRTRFGQLLCARPSAPSSGRARVPTSRVSAKRDDHWV